MVPFLWDAVLRVNFLNKSKLSQLNLTFCTSSAEVGKDNMNGGNFWMINFLWYVRWRGTCSFIACGLISTGLSHRWLPLWSMHLSVGSRVQGAAKRSCNKPAYFFFSCCTNYIPRDSTIWLLVVVIFDLGQIEKTGTIFFN